MVRRKPLGWFIQEKLFGNTYGTEFSLIFVIRKNSVSEKPPYVFLIGPLEEIPTRKEWMGRKINILIPQSAINLLKDLNLTISSFRK